MPKSAEQMYTEWEHELEKQGKLYSLDEESPDKSGGWKKTNQGKKMINSYFRNVFGRSPTSEELKVITNNPSAYTTAINQYKTLQGQGWTIKDGYMVPPGETPNQYLTDQEYQKLGDLQKELEKTKTVDTTTGLPGKVGNLANMGSWIANKIKAANLQAQIDKIEHEGKVTTLPPQEATSYEEANITPYIHSTVDPKTAAEVAQMYDDEHGGYGDDDYPDTADSYKSATGLNLRPTDDPVLQLQQDILRYTSELKKPYIEWGDQAKEALQKGIQEGAYTPDGQPIKDFQFKELRDGFMLRGYDQQRPEIQRFERGTEPALYETGDPYIPDRSDAPQFMPQTAYQRDTYQGREPITQYQKFQPGQAPEMRQIAADSQVQPYQQTGKAPDVYIAGEAPEANYYKAPTDTRQVYKAGEFRLEDDPGYQRRYKKALDAVESSAAARGMQLSGANLKALQEEAAAIASEETAAAYGRYADQRGFEAGQEQRQYLRDQATQDRLQSTSRFQNEDQYRRYLDSIGIRATEQDKRIAQFNQDRAFGADQNKEMWLREQAEKQLGRALNQDEFNRWMQTEGKRFAEYADQRDWTTQQSNLASEQDWRKYQYGTQFDAGQNRDQYGRDVDAYKYATDDYRWHEGMKTAGEQEQFNRDRLLYGDAMDNYKYGTDADFRSQQAYQAAKQTAYGQDKQDFYDLQNLRYGQHLGNLGYARDLQDKRYGQAMDIYNMDKYAKAQQYQTLGDVLRTGLGAQDATAGAFGNYGNFSTDWGVNKQNLEMAKKQQKTDKALNWSNFLLNLL